MRSLVIVLAIVSLAGIAGAQPEDCSNLPHGSRRCKRCCEHNGMQRDPDHQGYNCMCRPVPNPSRSADEYESAAGEQGRAWHHRYNNQFGESRDSWHDEDPPQYHSSGYLGGYQGGYQEGYQGGYQGGYQEANEEANEEEESVNYPPPVNPHAGYYGQGGYQGGESSSRSLPDTPNFNEVPYWNAFFGGNQGGEQPPADNDSPSTPRPPPGYGSYSGYDASQNRSSGWW